MIRGIVTDQREAVVRLTVVGSCGQKRSIEAVIDTGYDGFLTLPPEIIVGLALKWRRRGKAELADGGDTDFDVYEGIVVWDDRRRRIEVDEVDAAPMLGMGLLEGFRLNMKVHAGGQVLITRLPRSDSRQR